MFFEDWMLGMIDEAGYNGVRDEHLERLASSLKEEGCTEIDRETFERHCRKCCIDPSVFQDEDFERLEQILNQ